MNQRNFTDEDIRTLASAIVDELLNRTKASTVQELMGREEFRKILAIPGRAGNKALDEYVKKNMRRPR